MHVWTQFGRLQSLLLFEVLVTFMHQIQLKHHEVYDYFLSTLFHINWMNTINFDALHFDIFSPIFFLAISIECAGCTKIYFRLNSAWNIPNQFESNKNLINTPMSCNACVWVSVCVRFHFGYVCLPFAFINLLYIAIILNFVTIFSHFFFWCFFPYRLYFSLSKWGEKTYIEFWNTCITFKLNVTHTVRLRADIHCLIDVIFSSVFAGGNWNRTSVVIKIPKNDINRHGFPSIIIK